MLNRILSALAKEAALNGHGHSRRVDVKKPGGMDTAARHMSKPAGNAQTPFRYGRKLNTQKPVLKSSPSEGDPSVRLP